MTLKKILGHYALYTLILTGLTTPVFVAKADHHKTPFPSSGLLWMSAKKNFAGLVYVTSNNCNASETGAYTGIQNSTRYTAEMSKWYSTGIRMSQYRCDGVYSVYADLKINYNSTYPTGSWGINNDVVADPNFCAFWGVSYPCGVRPTVSINSGVWGRISDANRQRLIMHETGHSLGLNHHCTGDSIMNDGTSACNGGRWLVLSGYLATDRNGISTVYPYQTNVAFFSVKH